MVGNLSLTFGQPWWLILIPLIVPPLVWMSFRSLAGLGPARRALAILLRAGGHHPDRAGAGRDADGAAVRPADDDVRGRRLEQHSPRAAEGRDRVRHRRFQEAAQGRHGGSDRLRQGAPGRGTAGPQRAQPAGHREHDRPREHRPGRCIEAGPGHVPRGHGATGRDPLRRQREPGQPPRAGHGGQVAGGAGGRPAHRLPL